MRRISGILLCVMTVLALAANAFGAAPVEPKFKASKISVNFEGSPTDDMVAQAVKDFAAAGGEAAKATIILKRMDDAGLAKICKAFPEFSKLEVTYGELSNLAPLAELKALSQLSLIQLPQLTDLAPLGGLSTLTVLKVSDVAYANTDLQWMAPLTELKEYFLKLPPKGMASLAGIEGKPKLKKLSLTDGPLPDLTPLAALENLEELSLANTDGDLNPLKGCKKLKNLSLFSGKQKDLSPLAEVTSLKELTVYAMKRVEDFEALGRIKSLELVKAGATPMTSIAWVAELPKLRGLNFQGEKIEDYSPLSRATTLEGLAFWMMTLPDLDFLAPLAKLKTLNLRDVNKAGPALNLTPVAGLPSLNRLYLEEIQVTHFEALAGSKSITELYLKRIKDAGITDISVLEGVPTLKTVVIDKEDKGLFPEEQIKVLKDAGKTVR